MKIPSFICGDTRSVASAARAHVKRFLRGSPWIDPTWTMIDVDDAPRLIALNGPSPSLGSAPHVRVYAPFWELGTALAKTRTPYGDAARAFDEALAQPWALLGLLSQMCYGWFHDLDRRERFLAAITCTWHELDVVGPRYTRIGPSGRRLWDVPSALKYALAESGVPKARLHEPLPPGGLAALRASTRASA